MTSMLYIATLTFNPLALLIALRGLRTLNTLKILINDTLLDLKKKTLHILKSFSLFL